MSSPTPEEREGLRFSPWNFLLLLPFLMLAHSPLSGLINLVIIFIGLSKAWRLTTPFRASILGPYTGAPS